jgi:hypothetical protein
MFLLDPLVLALIGGLENWNLKKNKKSQVVWKIVETNKKGLEIN